VLWCVRRNHGRVACMSNRTPNYPFLFTVGGFLFGIGGPAGDVIKQTWPSAPPQLRPVLVVIGCALMLFATLGALWAIFGPKRDRPDGNETDAADVLHYLLHRSRWAEREHRRLNFRDFVNHLEEFRRAARDHNLRTSGIPAFGGQPEPIDSRHWASADIDPASAGRRGTVSTKTRARYPQHAREYAAIKVRTNDWERIWPRARFYDRWWTRAYVGMKKAWYLLTPDAWTYRWRKWRGTDKWRAE